MSRAHRLVLATPRLYYKQIGDVAGGLRRPVSDMPEIITAGGDRGAGADRCYHQLTTHMR